MRSAPPWLAWILRILYLDEVMDRYYDFRKVVVDLLANCCKEQKPELIPDLVVLANGFFESKATSMGLEPIEEKEVLSYYEEDARIWRLYQAMRKIDRRIRTWTGREYPYPIPPDIQR